MSAPEGTIQEKQHDFHPLPSTASRAGLGADVSACPAVGFLLSFPAPLSTTALVPTPPTQGFCCHRSAVIRAQGSDGLGSSMDQEKGEVVGKGGFRD